MRNRLTSFRPRSLNDLRSSPRQAAAALSLLAAALLAAAPSCAGGSDTQTPATSTTQGAGGMGGAGGGGAGGSTVCMPGETAECYSGPAETKGVGACLAGTMTCTDDGSSFGPCEGEVLPGKDDCATAADEDCDGLPAACQGEAIWATSAGDSNEQRLNSVAMSSSGEIVITGAFAGKITLGGQTLTSAGGFDIFVAKLDPTGKVVWSQSFGDQFDQSGNGVALDSSGNVFVTGDFKGTVNLGGEVLVSGGSEDIFVASLDPTGKHLWSKRFGDIAYQSGRSVAADSSGNVAVLCTVEGSTSFGGGLLQSAGGADVILAKLNPGGNHLYSKIFGGSGAESASEIVIDSKNNAMITGSFSGTAGFGGGSLVSAGGNDVFVARFTDAGIHLWSKGFGDAADQTGRSIDVDFMGNIVLAGAFLGAVDFGGGPLTSAGSEDIFVARLNDMGSHIWSKSFGDPAQQIGRAVAVDATGNVIVTGSLSGSADFGGGLLTSAGLSDVFLAKFSPEGEHLLSRAFGDAADQSGRALEVDASGFVVGGQFQGSLDLGTLSLTSSGAFDLFVTRIAP
jgi:hypothetical protein